MPKDIDGLRKYFYELNFSQKKDFIVNLKNKLDGVNSPPHAQLLQECVRAYNEEVRARNEKAGFEPKPKMPEISADTFARALATMIYGAGGHPSESAVKTRLIGKWQREPDDGEFFYKFNDDGTFSTNEFENAPPNGILTGNFTVSPDNIVLMEPHEKLKFTDLMFSQDGKGLIIRLKDGLTFEYRKV